MPAKSIAQRRAIAIAEHDPGELYGRDKGMLGMTRGQMHDFAATKEGGLPQMAVKPLTRGGKPRKSALVSMALRGGE